MSGQSPNNHPPHLISQWGSRGATALSVVTSAAFFQIAVRRLRSEQRLHRDKKRGFGGWGGTGRSQKVPEGPIQSWSDALCGPGEMTHSLTHSHGGIEERKEGGKKHFLLKIRTMRKKRGAIRPKWPSINSALQALLPTANIPAASSVDIHKLFQGQLRFWKHWHCDVSLSKTDE